MSWCGGDRFFQACNNCGNAWFAEGIGPWCQRCWHALMRCRRCSLGTVLEDHCIICGFDSNQEVVHRARPCGDCTQCDLCTLSFDPSGIFRHCARCNGLRRRCRHCRPVRWVGNSWLCTTCVVEDRWPTGIDVLVQVNTDGGLHLTACMALSGRVLITGNNLEETAFYDALQEHPELAEQRLARDGQAYTHSAFVAWYGHRLAELRWREAPAVPRRVRFLRGT